MSLKAFQNLTYRSQFHKNIQIAAIPNTSAISHTHTHSPIQRIQRRNFAGNEEVRYPKVFKNVFNKRVSRDGKRVYYDTFPYDYNEPWPFPPVYDKETGQDLNHDPVWGDGGEAPNSSITGKPRRALGHYPWLGRPIVPLDDHRRFIMDDQVAPYPFFQQGRYEANRVFYWQWTLFFGVWFVVWYLLDFVWRGDGKYGNLSNQRDELFYKEHMASSMVAFAPLGTCWYGNPCAPWRRTFDASDEWVQKNDWVKMRFTSVFVPGAKEDMFADEDVNYFKLPGYNC